jgi:hypothetical protein
VRLPFEKAVIGPGPGQLRCRRGSRELRDCPPPQDSHFYDLQQQADQGLEIS